MRDDIKDVVRKKYGAAALRVANVVISNCVINLSADKDRVLAEAFRVLRPGGRLAVSDGVVRGKVDAIAPQVAGKFMSAFVRARKPRQHVA